MNSGDLTPEPKSPENELIGDELITWFSCPCCTCENGTLELEATAAAAAIVAPAEW